MRILPTEEGHAVSMRCRFSAARIALEAVRTNRTLRASASKPPVHANRMNLPKR